MRLTSSLLPIRQGASATLELSAFKPLKASEFTWWAPVLTLQSPFGKTKLEINGSLHSDGVPKDGFPADLTIVEVQPWENIGAVDERGLTDGGQLFYQIAFQFSVDFPGSSYPHEERAIFKILADRWNEFFNPTTFVDLLKENT